MSAFCFWSRPSFLKTRTAFRGADLAALVHEASIIALKARLFADDRSVDAVTMEHFVKAIQNIRPSVTEADRKKYQRMKEVYGLKRRNNEVEMEAA